jgi:carbon-monoxide dehydrogenase large subunit
VRQGRPAVAPGAPGSDVEELKAGADNASAKRVHGREREKTREETQMGIEGIGARVARKEDKRFITGKGRYTDDMSVAGMKHAAFVRSPHAHAEHQGIDTSEAAKMPGVIGVLAGDELAADGIGSLICGWMIHSKDGSPMNMGDWRPLAQPRCAMSAMRLRSSSPTPRPRRATPPRRSRSPTRSCRRSPRPSMPETGRAAIHDNAPGNLIYDWEIGDSSAPPTRRSQRRPCHPMDIVNNRLVPNAMEPRAALGHYDEAEDHYTCWTTSQNPHVARLVMSAFYNVAPENKLRVIAPDVGGGFGSKIYIYPGRDRLPLGLEEDRRSGQVGGRPHRELPHRRAWPRPCHDGRDGLRRRQQDHRPEGRHDRQSRRLHVAVLVVVPTYLYATLLSGQYTIPAIHCNVRTVYTNTAPVDAYRGAGRPEATYLLERTVETAARELGVSPAELRRKNFIREFPYQTPVIMAYDAGDYEASLDAAMKAADYDGFPARKAEAGGRGKKRGIGMSCYIEACGIAPSQAVGSLGAGVGLWESAEVRVNAVGTVEILTGSHSHGQGHETTFAQLVSDRFGVPIDSVSSSMATPTRCRWAWEHTARAPARSA